MSLVQKPPSGDVWNQFGTITGNTAGASTFYATNLVMSGGANITLSVNSDTLAIIGAAGGTGGGGTQTAISAIGAPGSTLTSGSVYFANANGVSFGMSGVGGFPQSITASHNGYSGATTQWLTTAALSNHTHGTVVGTNVNATSASSGLSLSVPISYLTAGANITLSTTGSTVSIIGAAGGTGGGGGAAISASGNSQNTGTVNFAAANGVSFGLSNNGTMTASFASSALTAGTGITLSTTGSTVSIIGKTDYMASNEPHVRGVVFGSATQTSGTVWITGSGGITVTNNGASAIISFDGHHIDAVVPSGNGYGTGFSGISTGTLGLNFVGAISASQNGGNLSLSVPAQTVQPAVGLNTAQTNATWTVNSSGISFNGAGYAGTGTSATNASITLNSNGLAISVAAPGAGAAPQVSFWPLPRHWDSVGFATVNSGTTGATGGSSQTTASYRMCPFPVNADVHFNDVDLMVNANTVAGTGGGQAAHLIGLYTLNASTAYSLVSSWVWNWKLTQNSVTAQSHSFWWGTNSTSNSFGLTNSSVSVTGTRRVEMVDSPQTLTAGQYFMVHVHTASSNAANVINVSSLGLWSNANTTFGGYLGSATGATVAPTPGFGVFSSTSNATAPHQPVLPSSIHTSAITNTGGSTQWMQPAAFLYRGGFP